MLSLLNVSKFISLKISCIIGKVRIEVVFIFFSLDFSRDLPFSIFGIELGVLDRDDCYSSFDLPLYYGLL